MAFENGKAGLIGLTEIYHGSIDLSTGIRKESEHLLVIVRNMLLI